MSLGRPVQICLFQCTRCSSRHPSPPIRDLNLRSSPSTIYTSFSQLHVSPTQSSFRSKLRARFSTASPLLAAKPSISPNTAKSKAKQPQGPTPPNTTPAGSSSESWSSKIYTFEDIQSLITNPDSKRILIGMFPSPFPPTSPLPPSRSNLLPGCYTDVREPSELRQTGKIPTALNIPITTSPDAFFLSASEFEDRYQLPRPDADTEVVFYCKAGVRSRAAAKLARQAGFGGRTAEYPGSWREWEGRAGETERAGE